MDIRLLNNFRFDSNSSRIVGFSEADIDGIREVIKDSGVVVLKNVFVKNEILSLRKSVFEYFLNKGYS